MRASGVAARRILVKAATLSPKNIVPKAEVSKSYSSSAAVAGSLCRQSILARPAALARLSPSASIGAEMSIPPRGRTERRRGQTPAWARRSRSRYPPPARRRVVEGQCLWPYRHRQGQICEFPAGDPKPKFDDTRLIAVCSPRNQPRPRSKCFTDRKGDPLGRCFRLELRAHRERPARFCNLSAALG